ncbi:sodium/glutamate symporter [Chryseobacterium salipaludis]|uniref:sodium/glutamate symporter n=1 Tax=Chryseobacterium TaxID=59732 RepID=UPI001FF60444|nr:MULTISPECIES: sodium/glutamate symporter [Chryseobacterium]MCJ8497127.1 sodium/glutamate symporter [Chryseobacterium salipaludis]MCX3296609.1 sodium/glutamate symporter [Planobacterium sp. JC490]
MKKNLHKLFLILIGIVLIGKLSSWFLNYNDETNHILNIGMFTLIGIAYLVGGFVWGKKPVNIIFLTCGTYLIIMNFIGDFGLKPIIGIVCILTPMLIARFSRDETDENELADK